MKTQMSTHTHTREHGQTTNALFILLLFKLHSSASKMAGENVKPHRSSALLLLCRYYYCLFLGVMLWIIETFFIITGRLKCFATGFSACAQTANALNSSNLSKISIAYWKYYYPSGRLSAISECNLFSNRRFSEVRNIAGMVYFQISCEWNLHAQLGKKVVSVCNKFISTIIEWR